MIRSQKKIPCSRVAAGISSGPFQLTNRPAATVASTPEPPKCCRNQKGDIGRHQRQRDLDARIARPAAQPQADPADADAEGDFADDDQGERAGCLRQREQAGCDRGDREAVEDQSGGIVGETFALEHDEQPARQAELADDGERRDRVGRRHDGAEHEAERPAACRARNAPPPRPRQLVKITQPNASSVIGRRLKRNSRQLMATPAE